jgi:hypothetical protein
VADHALVLPRSDLALWPYSLTSRSPLWVGLAIAIAYVAVTLVLDELMVGLGFEPVSSFSRVWVWSVFVNGALLGFLPTANAYLHRGVQRDLRALRPVLRCDDARFETLRVEVGCVPGRRLRRAGAIGALIGLGVALYDPTVRAFHAGYSPVDPRFLWLLVHNVAFVWLGARLLVTEVHMTRAFQRIGEERVTVDLLDPGLLVPFARKGQRSVVLWAVFSAIFSGFWLLDSAADVNVLVPVVVVVVMTAAFLLPVAGVRRSVRAAKHAELDRIRRELHRERAGLLEPGAEARESGRVGDLVAYRTLIEGIREWPFDVSALARFAFFATLGVGSWLGGALVERLLDALLG